MSITIQTGMNNGHKGFHMQNRTYQKIVTFAGITGWKPISIKSGNTAPKGGISTNIEFFPFILDDSMIKY